MRTCRTEKEKNTTIHKPKIKLMFLITVKTFIIDIHMSMCVVNI